jgi:hypothetical protein
MLNSMTLKNKYPLLLIPELIAKLQGAKYITKLDVCWGFNNVCMKEGGEWKATFQTNCSLFELLIMFFGLTNSPATSDVGSTSPPRNTRPHHLAITRWRPKFSKKGWQEVAKALLHNLGFCSLLYG